MTDTPPPPGATPNPQAQAGPLTIKGKLRYQACDDRVCYLPKDLALEWTFVN